MYDNICSIVFDSFILFAKKISLSSIMNDLEYNLNAMLQGQDENLQSSYKFDHEFKNDFQQVL